MTSFLPFSCFLSPLFPSPPSPPPPLPSFFSSLFMCEEHWLWWVVSPCPVSWADILSLGIECWPNTKILRAVLTLCAIWSVSALPCSVFCPSTHATHAPGHIPGLSEWHPLSCSLSPMRPDWVPHPQAAGKPSHPGGQGFLTGKEAVSKPSGSQVRNTHPFSCQKTLSQHFSI